MTNRDSENLLVSVILRLEVGLPYWCFSPEVAIPLSLVAAVLTVITERLYAHVASRAKRILFLAGTGLVQTAFPVGLLVATSRYRWPELGWRAFSQEKFQLMVLYGSAACLGIAVWRAVVVSLMQLVESTKQRRSTRAAVPPGEE